MRPLRAQIGWQCGATASETQVWESFSACAPAGPILSAFSNVSRPSVLSLADCISILTIISLFSKLVPKSPGDNMLVPEFYSVAPVELAFYYFVLFFKSHVFGVPPVFYRGGNVLGLYKGSGSFFDSLNYW